MNKAFSIYLDLVRFVAACLVYLYHSNQRWLSVRGLPASDFGHSAVIVFFVLSGFVIAYITDTRESTWASYAASRISRVYSVALPAVLLTVVLDALGRQLLPAVYDYPFDHILLRVAASLLLLNEVWWVSITSFSNVPYWSIAYEMWYYVAFGMRMFLPRRMGLLGLALLALALGPKVVLLAPIWALGVLLYRWKWLADISEATGWLLAVGSVLGMVAFHHAQLTERVAALTTAWIGPAWQTELTFSKFFPSDYLLGALVFMNFAGMRRVSARWAPVLLPLARPIRFLAGYTLSLYLLHQPLFLFWAAVVRGDAAGYGYWWRTTALVAASVWAVGAVTESRRHLLRRWLLLQLHRLHCVLPTRDVARL